MLAESWKHLRGILVFFWRHFLKDLKNMNAVEPHQLHFVDGKHPEIQVICLDWHSRLLARPRLALLCSWQCIGQVSGILFWWLRHTFSSSTLFIFSVLLSRPISCCCLLFIFLLKLQRKLMSDWAKLTKIEAPERQDFCLVFSTTEPPVPETISGLLASPYVCGMNILLIDHDWD